MTAQPTDPKHLLDRFLGIFAEVRAGEGLAAVLLFVNVLLIMASYYVLKTVRQGLIIGGGGMFGLDGAELKAYASAGMAFLLLGVVPAYGRLASRVVRIKLLNYSVASVIVSLAIFFALANAGVEVALAFYLWLGIVNVFLIAQFWSYANDLYSEEQGKRLFAIIAIGGTLGAIVGPKLAKIGDDINVLMLLSAGIFGVCMLLYNLVNRLEAGRTAGHKDAASQEEEKPLSKEGGFQLVFQQKYLLLIAVMILVSNLVNTTGEYILDSAANDHAEEAVPPVDEAALRASLLEQQPSATEAEIQARIEAERAEVKSARERVSGNFYADFFFYMNLAGFLIQALLVSRIFKYLGLRAALFVLPIVAMGGYAAIGLIGGIALIRVAKTAENSTDYSLQNTVKQALYLPTSREVKYKAKAAIDTFFVRIGDTASAGLVALGLHVLGFTAKSFALTNCALVVVWLLVVVAIAREHRKLVPDDRKPPG